MDVKKWSALLCAVKLGSLSKAAEELGYTQSGITYLINSLEEECGLSLLQRSWDGVHLSSSGVALARDITALIDADTQLSRHIDEIKNAQERCIRIGLYTSISVHWFSKVIGLFQSQFPDTEIELYVGNRDLLSNRLLERSIDIAFSDYLGLSSTLWTELYVDPLVAVLPLNHPAALKHTFSPEDAGNTPFLIPPDTEMSVSTLQTQFARRANVRMQVDNSRAMLSLIEEGVGFSILPELTLLGRAERVVVLPLSEPLYRHLGVNRAADFADSQALRALLRLMRTNPPTPLNTQE